MKETKELYFKPLVPDAHYTEHSDRFLDKWSYWNFIDIFKIDNYNFHPGH